MQGKGKAALKGRPVQARAQQQYAPAVIDCRLVRPWRLMHKRCPSSPADTALQSWYTLPAGDAPCAHHCHYAVADQIAT
jgi:hypothetical protein